MITRLTLRDFKCFPKADVAFKDVNVFAGANGAGKSTILQALLVLFQSAQSGALARNRVQLNGPLVELGTGKEVLYRRSEMDSFGITIEDTHSTLRVLALVPAEKDTHTLSTETLPPDSDLRALTRRLMYLAADRIGPQLSYPINMDDSSGNPIGRRGEFAPLIYQRSKPQNITNPWILLEGDGPLPFHDLETQFTRWMGRLFPGFEAETDSIDQMDAIRLGVSLHRQIGQRDFSRPSNTGFGVSVAFPIVLAGLLAAPGTVLIVDTPEAHLHPTAQSLIGEFLVRVAAGGAQVFIETHSDHVVNGMRLAVKNGVSTTEGVQFFAIAKTPEYGSSVITPITVDSKGNFSVQPDTFFDQIDKDLRLIYDV